MSAQALSVGQSGMAAAATPLPLPVPPPPPPPPPGGLRRRPALLGSLAAILAAPTIEAATPAAHPDAELIALCGRYGVLVDQIQAVYDAMPEDYSCAQERAYDAEHVDPLYDQKSTLLGQIEKLPAKTLDGLRARVEMLIKESPYLLTRQSGVDETMISDVLQDVLALTGGHP